MPTGRWWVQDAAAAIPARLLEPGPGARVLDLCAAPGGKTAQLVKAGYAVTALDNEPDRVARLRENLARLGYDAEVVTADALAWQPEQKFDGILLDAPCSATGTFRRHPEVIWHRTAADIAGRVALQRRFIERALGWLNPGGVLIYCVCSLEPAGRRRAGALARHPRRCRGRSDRRRTNCPASRGRARLRATSVLIPECWFLGIRAARSMGSSLRASAGAEVSLASDPAWQADADAPIRGRRPSDVRTSAWQIRCVSSRAARCCRSPTTSSPIR